MLILEPAESLMSIRELTQGKKCGLDQITDKMIWPYC